MGKALSIKDSATYALVAELAARTGVSMTQAVGDAVAERLAALNAQRVEAAAAWLERIKASPPEPGFMAQRWQPDLEEPRS